MKIVDMRPSEDDNKDEGSPAASDSYGLRIHLGGDQLDKLGMKELPKAGDEHDIAGKIKVLSVRIPADGDQGDERRIEMHITHLGVEKGKEPSLRDELSKAADKAAPAKK